jgi:acetyl esterase
MAPLHPQAQALLDQMAAMGAPPLYEQPLEDARGLTAALREMVGEGPPMEETRKLAIPVPGAELTAYLHRPVPDPAGIVVYFHGGGWVVGNSEDIDASLQLLAATSGCDVIGVDYRLAPEEVFPVALEDAYEAARWIAANLAEGRPLVVAGDSAGGTLSTLIALRARDRGDLDVAAQVLFYPVTDGRMETESYAIYGDAGLLLGRAEMAWFWGLYAPDPETRLSPEASPLLAESHGGLPPALVVVAEYDPLRDEVRAYAEALRAAGGVVRVAEFDDVFHGFATMPNLLERGNEALELAGEFVRDAVSAPSVA